jgi:hypothetical protein
MAAYLWLYDIYVFSYKGAKPNNRVTVTLGTLISRYNDTTARELGEKSPQDHKQNTST